MADHLSKAERSWNMSRIRSRNTGPERQVRSLLHRAGYRFRLNGRVGTRLQPKGVLPGKPDIVLAKFRTVIFVHGCFWHRHPGCRQASTPKSNHEFWQAKFERNTARDQANTCELRKLGWRVLTVWECELKHPESAVAKIIANFANPSPLVYPATTPAQLLAAETEPAYSAKQTPVDRFRSSSG